jgi:hypothetical protein
MRNKGHKIFYLSQKVLNTSNRGSQRIQPLSIQLRGFLNKKDFSRANLAEGPKG